MPFNEAEQARDEHNMGWEHRRSTLDKAEEAELNTKHTGQENKTGNTITEMQTD